MAVMTREKWTDERLDDLAGRVDRGFAEVKGEIGDLRTEMNGRLDSVNGRFDSFQAEMNSRFDSMQWTMIIGFASIVASVVGGVFAALSLG
jgi:tetrahydromethanopterin S-methyltransferase subunit G